jgi:hypothetical protein
MKKYSLLKENQFYKLRESLSDKISTLGEWIYLSEGLNMMNVIDTLFEEMGYKQKISFEEVAKFNKGFDFLKKTDIDQDWISQRMQWKLPGGKIENASYVVDESGNWHYVNKLNTNHSDLSLLIADMIVRSISENREKGDLAIQNIMSNPKETLSNWKPYMKELLRKYFIEKGDGLEDFKKFTFFSQKFTKEGSEYEEKIAKLLEENDFEIVYSGGNGDFIDMLFGVDMIVFKEGVGYKTVQVKKRIDWPKIQYYKVNWIASGLENKIYDKKNKDLIL